MTLARRIIDIEESPTMAVTARATQLKASGQPVIGFGAGEPDFPTPENIVEAAVRAARDPASHRYSAASGLPELREAVATMMREQRSVPVEAAQVTITNGGKHGLYNVFMTLVTPGDEVVLSAPYWVSYPEQIRLCGGVPVVVDTTVDQGFLATVEQLEAVRTDRTRALVLVSPSNPTGAVHTPDEIEAIARWAASHDIWVITDEIYAQLVYGDATFRSAGSIDDEVREHVVIVDGVSKSHAMTGWRVGWTIAPAAVAAGINKLQSHLTSNVCNVAQRAALEALTGPQGTVATMRDAFDRRRHLAVEHLSRIAGVTVAEPRGAFYVFPSFEGILGRELSGRTVHTTMDLADVLLDTAHVALVPGEAFGAPGHARLSYALGDEDLVEGITRIADVLAQ
ncbi:MAG: pyridoxal phosphate-dependent aminotransferase [Nitriliruptoraceae bacterium]